MKGLGPGAPHAFRVLLEGRDLGPVQGTHEVLLEWAPMDRVKTPWLPEHLGAVLAEE